MRTLPSVSIVAVWRSRAAVIEPVGLKTPVLGSYNSAAARAEDPPVVSPPAMRTRPSKSSVAECLARAADIEPVELNLPVLGSYSSAELR
jgi:hypothetical protein